MSCRAVRSSGRSKAHVATCANCLDVLERLAADVSVSDRRGPAPVTEPEHPPAIPGFVIESLLGRGGMGVVYQAWQPQLARRVAIKVVSASAAIGAEHRRRRPAQGAGDRAGATSQHRAAPRSR